VQKYQCQNYQFAVSPTPGVPVIDVPVVTVPVQPTPVTPTPTLPTTGNEIIAKVKNNKGIAAIAIAGLLWFLWPSDDDKKQE